MAESDIKSTEVPETLEGWYCLHDFRTLNWQAWKQMARAERATAVAELADHLREVEAEEGSSGLYSIVGHKADLMFLHLRPTTDELDALERRLARTSFADFLSRPYSYVSVTELSLYEAQARGAIANPMEVPFVRARLQFRIPADKPYMVFYPMNKRRGEHLNWYTASMDERRAMMRSHGTIGHKYFGVVQQMITGSVGLDDWEWGVTLFAADPLPFKKLVYEMRFDEVSAKYAEFGPFLVGKRLSADDLEATLAV